MQPQPKNDVNAKPVAVTPERIMQISWAYAAPLILDAAVHHEIFDVLDAGPKSARQVARDTSTSERGARVILDALVSLQFLSKDSDGRYALTSESSAFLVSSKPSFQGGIFRHISTQLVPKWLQLREVVRSGKPAMAVNDEGEGGMFFEQFVEDIFPMSVGSAQVLADALRLSESRETVKVLDLAAGSGVWGIVLAKANAKVRVTAVDWVRVIGVTRKVAQKHGVADRFTFIDGDLLEANLGAGHHVATLGHILHSEGERRSRELLRRTFDALAPGGTIAIAEFLVDESHTSPPTGALFAVNMLVNTTDGDTFSFTEIAAWLREAGFVNPRLLDAPGPSPLILADKPR